MIAFFTKYRQEFIMHHIFPLKAVHITSAVSIAGFSFTCIIICGELTPEQYTALDYLKHRQPELFKQT